MALVWQHCMGQKTWLCEGCGVCVRVKNGGGGGGGGSADGPSVSVISRPEDVAVQRVRCTFTWKREGLPGTPWARRPGWPGDMSHTYMCIGLDPLSGNAE